LSFVGFLLFGIAEEQEKELKLQKERPVFQKAKWDEILKYFNEKHALPDEKQRMSLFFSKQKKLNQELIDLENQQTKIQEAIGSCFVF
jgi:hypothetical protein